VFLEVGQVTFTASKLLILIGLVLFVLAAFSVTFGGIGVGWLGLAFFSASFLVP
jgi:membrane-bound ClpP family serine protease